MKVAVFMGASTPNDERYMKAAKRFGRLLAKYGHELVFGGSFTGLMGEVARGFLDLKGVAHGLEIKKYYDESLKTDYDRCATFDVVDDLPTRKTMMINMADAYVVLPGGVGTLDEAFEVLTIKQMDGLTKPVVFYDMFGFYENLKKHLKGMVNKKVYKFGEFDKIVWARNAGDVMDALR